MSAQLIPYGYSILDYSRKYDDSWIEKIDKLKALLFPFGQNLKPVPVQERNTRSGNFIPDVNVFQIMSYLNGDDLLIVGNVCKSWSEFASRDELWNNLLRSKFAVSAESIRIGAGHTKNPKSKQVPSKLIYKKMLFALQNILLHFNGAQMKAKPVMPNYIFQHSIASH